VAIFFSRPFSSPPPIFIFYFFYFFIFFIDSPHHPFRFFSFWSFRVFGTTPSRMSTLTTVLDQEEALLMDEVLRAQQMIEEHTSAKDADQVRRTLRRAQTLKRYRTESSPTPTPSPIKTQMPPPRGPVANNFTPSAFCDSSLFFWFDPDLKCFRLHKGIDPKSLTNIYRAEKSPFVIVGDSQYAICYSVVNTNTSGVMLLRPLPLAMEHSFPIGYLRLFDVTFNAATLVIGSRKASFAMYCALPLILTLPQTKNIEEVVQDALQKDKSLAIGLSCIVSSALDELLGPEEEKEPFL
jgi:hypothetical protein